MTNLDNWCEEADKPTLVERLQRGELCPRHGQIIDSECVSCALVKAEREIRALLKIASFGERCLEAFQESYSDLDGCWIQDTAVDCGVLVEVTATGPCDPEHCECAGMTDFPTKCYRRAPDIADAAMGAKEGE